MGAHDAMSGEPIIHCAPVALEGGVGGALDVRDMRYAAGARFARHDHGYASLFVMIRGHVREQAGRQPVECPAGAVGFIPAGAEHRSAFGESPAHGLTVVFGADWLRRFAGDGDLSAPGYAQNPVVSAAASRLYCACRRADSARSLAVEESLLDLLRWVGARPPTPDGVRRVPGWVDDVTDLVRARGGEPISLGDVAEAVDRHPAHVCRAFRGALGCSISEYVQCVRLERACELLRAKERPLAGVALEAGFYDQPHFSRVFRRLIGVTPREYRDCLA